MARYTYENINKSRDQDREDVEAYAEANLRNAEAEDVREKTRQSHTEKWLW